MMIYDDCTRWDMVFGSKKPWFMAIYDDFSMILDS
jgi:hypothetical protein